MRLRHLAMVVLALGTLIFLADASAQSKLTPLQKRLLSGFASSELGLHERSLTAAQAPNFALGPSSLLTYFPVGIDDLCSERKGSNVKVNQSCLNLTDPDLQGRGQAANETAIAEDPNHRGHLVAAKNDYRHGDASCIAAYSLDNGEHWNDSLAPIGFTRAVFSVGGVNIAREYWEASGDPSVAWDTKGNAYITCQAFQRGFPVTTNVNLSSGVNVFRSTHNNGASWNFPGRSVWRAIDSLGTGGFLEDKPYMTVDNHVGSPFQDRIYVTWTEFLPDGSAYIWEGFSEDYGESFATRFLVSGNNTTLCTNTFGAGSVHGNCNANTNSQPFTGSDGALYVVFDNYNNSVSGSDNRNQVLLVKSTDGGVTFSSPVKVADFYDLPDCATYQGGQNPGRACVPEKGASVNSVFRATNYPVGAVSPRNPRTIAVTFGSYINVHSKESNGCVPTGLAADLANTFTGVKTAGACNNDILLSVSTNGGATFTGGATDPRLLPTINQASGQDVTDQWWQWAAFADSGELAVSYYDRRYGSDEATGFSDVSVSVSSDRVHFSTKRVTSSSMPTPTQFPDAQGNSVFFGDYSGLLASEDVHPIWMDTRNLDLFLCPGTGRPGAPPQLCTAAGPDGVKRNTQDVFTTNVEIDK